MADQDFFVQFVRFDATNPGRMVFCGCFRDDNPEGRTLHAYVNRKEVPVNSRIREGDDVRERYQHLRANIGQEIIGYFPVADAEGVKRVEITGKLNESETRVAALGKRELKKIRKKLDCDLEKTRKEGEDIVLTGWVVAAEDLEIRVAGNFREVPCRVERRYRGDINDRFPELDEEYMAGFEVRFEDMGGRIAEMNFMTGYKNITHRIFLSEVRKGKGE